MSRRILWAKRIPTGDGDLVADVVFPPGHDETTGPLPTLVARTPYGRQSFLHDVWLRLVDRGYVLVTCDLRGRGDSDGRFTPWQRDTGDGVTVIEWAAAQPWSDGQVGTIGGSYDGLTQWWAAAGRPEPLRCMVPMAVGVRARPGGRPFMDTGIPWQYWMWWFAYTAGRTLQDVTAPAWGRHWAHRPLRSFHEATGFPSSAWPDYVEGRIDCLGSGWALSDEELAAVDVPVLVTLGWWDDLTTLETWQVLQAGPHAADKHLLVGAWDHVGNIVPRMRLGGEDVSAGTLDPLGVAGDFLDRHLKGGTAELPRARVWHSGTNHWEDLAGYPVASGEAVLHLGDTGVLREEEPVDGFDEWWHNAADPVATLTPLDNFAWSDPPHDQRYLEARPDVCTYTSAPLAEPLTVSGRVRFDLSVSADAADADVFAWVTDVHPDGRSMLPAGFEIEGRRLSVRNGPDPEPLSDGEIVRVGVDAQWLHHTFAAGHRIRILVSSAFSPTCAPVTGSEKHWADEEYGRPFAIRVHYGPTNPSTVRLPRR
ncbi:CocE/NonD family hydrolase [Amycolatopsis jejuensis]|uniref:CocE/NonD family hydrolase n=1 Tax=Amycolatopsis jejuensis TaxID=330084 RepID=UPI00052766C3|nr:CocE/NonD family hydrolase [Amycolatopsis jejuensis]